MKNATKTKDNPEKANNTKYSKRKLAWFGRLLRPSAKRRGAGGLILFTRGYTDTCKYHVQRTHVTEWNQFTKVCISSAYWIENNRPLHRTFALDCVHKKTSMHFLCYFPELCLIYTKIAANVGL